MIDRLLRLSVEDFRILGGRNDLPLDADVVLIHGNNGTGKSSLLYAIEVALTGHVADLRGYKKDYPRCLRSLEATGSGTVSVEYESGGLRHVASATVHPGASEVESESRLDPESLNFFVERCFLSQVRLSRLIESYQTVGQGRSEPPIVTFVKQLLNLEVIENLNEVLHDFDDKRRLPKAYSHFADLDVREARNTKLQAALRDEITECESKQKARIDEAIGLLDSIGESVAIQDWHYEGVEALRAKLESEKLSGVSENQLDRLLDAQLQLKSFRALIENFGGDSESQVRVCEAELAELGRELDATRKDLDPRLEVVHLELSELGDTVSLPDWGRDPDYLLLACSEVLGQLLRKTTGSLEARASIAQQLKKIDEEMELANQESSVARQEIVNLSVGLSGKVDLLAELTSELEGDLCPVCLRDFSETNSGSLREFLARRISELGEKAKRIQVQAERVSHLESRRASGERSKSILMKQSEAIEESESLQLRLARLQDLEVKMRQLQAIASKWRSVRDAHRDAQSRLQIARGLNEQTARMQGELSSIAELLSIGSTPDVSTSKWIDALEQGAVVAVESARKRIAAIRRGGEVLRAIAAGFKEREELDARWLKLDATVQATSRARRNVDDLIRSAKGLLKASVSAKGKLLESVFSDRLNRLWADLFERLVPEELFRPKLSEPSSRRDQIKTAINAFAEGHDAFENLGAIFSLAILIQRHCLCFYR